MLLTAMFAIPLVYLGFVLRTTANVPGVMPLTSSFDLGFHHFCGGTTGQTHPLKL